MPSAIMSPIHRFFATSSETEETLSQELQSLMIVICLQLMGWVHQWLDGSAANMVVTGYDGADIALLENNS